jgi:predicted O-methyltransferase YrrM
MPPLPVLEVFTQPMMNASQQCLFQLANILPKIQRRMPSGLQQSHLWARFEDELYRRGLFLGPSGRKIFNSFHSLVTPEEWFEFAGKVFPAHQQQGEILDFLAMVAMRNPRVILEIGTAQSGTNFLLAQVLVSVETIIAMDLRVRNTRLLSMFSRPALNRICLEGSSHSLSSLDKVKHVLSGSSLDLLFIDGDHSYEGVSSDYQMYSPLVRKGGLIAFHDIVDDHQTKYGRPSLGCAGGVPIFWRELKSTQDPTTTWEFIADPDQDGMGIGVLQV